MPKGGARPGSGRPKGAKNTKTKEFIEKVSASGLMPLDYLLEQLRNEALDPDDRFKAAVAAAPYVHAKLAAVEHSTDPENPLKHVHKVEWTIISGAISDRTKG